MSQDTLLAIIVLAVTGIVAGCVLHLAHRHDKALAKENAVCVERGGQLIDIYGGHICARLEVVK